MADGKKQEVGVPPEAGPADAQKGKKPIVKEEIEELQKRVGEIEKRLEELPSSVANPEDINALRSEIAGLAKEVGEYKAVAGDVGKKCDEVLKYFHAIGDEEKVAAVFNSEMFTKGEIDSFLGGDESEDLLAGSGGADDIDGLFPGENDKGPESASESAYDAIKIKVREAVDKKKTRFSATGPLDNYVMKLAVFAGVEPSRESLELLRVYVAERITGSNVMGKIYKTRKEALGYLRSKKFSDGVQIKL